ncbi:MAG: fatty acid desaturase [Pseudomonadota bacterium]
MGLEATKRLAEPPAQNPDRELLKTERDIAQRFKGGVPWGAVVWGLGNFALWLALWPLTLSGVLPLWFSFILATISVTVSYLPSHEAQHDIIARPGQKLRWLNELVGHTSTIPLALPYRMAKLTHIEHHKHTNDPDLDPDYGTHAKGPFSAIWKSIERRQPGSKTSKSYGATLRRIGTPQSKLAMRDAMLYQLGFYSILFAIAWSGFALEAALLWWLPKHIAMTYIDFFLSWSPHHPAEVKGRYRDTRAFRSHLGNIGSMGMQFHIVHHLHPTIPLMRTPAAYHALSPVLEARGCDLGGL